MCIYIYICVQTHIDIHVRCTCISIPIYLCLSNYLPIYLSICLSTYLRMYLPLYLPTYLIPLFAKELRQGPQSSWRPQPQGLGLALLRAARPFGMSVNLRPAEGEQYPAVSVCQNLTHLRASSPKKRDAYCTHTAGRTHGTGTNCQGTRTVRSCTRPHRIAAYRLRPATRRRI